jgi:tetratricopeptide (TPR) repeat protein
MKRNNPLSQAAVRSNWIACYRYIRKLGFAMNQLMRAALRTSSLLTGKERRLGFAGLLMAGTVFFSCDANAQEAATQSPSKKPIEVVIPKSFDGDDDFNEACRLRINVDSVDTLKEIITLAKSGLEKGLDKVDTEAAKKLIASSYLQKTQEGIRAVTPNLSRAKVSKLLNDFVDDLGEAIKYDPLMADAYLMKAELHARRREVAIATEVANEGIKALVPHVDSKLAEPETKQKLGKLFYMRAGLQPETDDGINDLKRSIEYDPNNQAAIAVLTESLVREERGEDALEFFKRLLIANSENETIIQNTAQLMASDPERMDEALELLNNKIKILPNSAALLKTRAKVFAVKKDAVSAKADLDRVLELSKNDTAGLLDRARVALQVDDLDAARRDVDAALELEPNRIDGILLRAAIAAEQKRYRDAIEDIRLIIKDQPKESPNIGLLIQLGLYYSFDDRPNEAVKVFGQVIKLDSENWLAYSMRGDTLLGLREYSRAVADFEKALELSPKDNPERSGILNNLSWTLSTSHEADVRNGKRALEMGLQACELTEYQKPHILSTLAAAYAELGQFDKAVEWAEKAVNLGEETSATQLDQLKEELESYRQKKPWREKSEAKQNKIPLAPRDSGVDT